MNNETERKEREERAARLVWARRNAGFRGPKDVADKFGFNVNNYKAHEAGRNGFGLADAKAYAEAFGVSLAWLQHNEGTWEPDGKPMIPIVGRVGASTDGAIIHDTGDQGSFGQIEAPAGATGGEVAVEVRGHSMGIYAPDGSVIIYDSRRDPPTDDLLGEVCVVGLPDGRVLLKRLLRGSRKGLFDLESLVGETMRDQRVEWAAVVALVVHPRRAKLLRVA